MAISAENMVQSFVYLGIKDFLIRDRETKKEVCKLKHLVNINLSDETSQEFLRGGYKNPKLLVLYGDRNCQLTASTSTQSADLIKVMFNNDTVTKTKSLPVVETLNLADGTFALSKTPSTGVPITVFKVDANTGKELKPALVVGTPVSNPTDYSILTNKITCHSTVKKIVVSYNADVEVESLEMADGTPKNWEACGILYAKEIETGNIYKAWLELPNISFLPKNTISAKNESGTPDAVEFTVDLMNGADGYPYALDFQRETVK